MDQQTKPDKLHSALSIILGILYVPYAIFCFFCFMATETVLWETDPYMIAAANVFAWSGVITALTAHLCLFISHKARRSGKRIASWLIMFAPIFAMAATSLLMIITEAIVKG